MGWIKTGRPGNDGGVGNTLEDLLEIPENNFALSNTNEWELKAQRAETSSLVTLFHFDPSPRKARCVAGILVPKYGWPHEKHKLCFHHTVSATRRTDRGFGILVDRAAQKVVLSFDASAVDPRHDVWLASVKKRVGLAELDPQPYWGFDDLTNKAGTKLLNCVFVTAKCERRGGDEYFLYEKIMLLTRCSGERFITAIESGEIKVDFDARIGKNRGVKFRTQTALLPKLYDEVLEVDAATQI